MCFEKSPSFVLESSAPSCFRMTKLSLALKVFTYTNIAALKHFDTADTTMENWEETSNFKVMICKWWDIVDVHHLHKGRNTNNPDACPIYHQADAQLKFLLNLREWLKSWNCNPICNEECLSRDTYLAFSHT